MLKTLKMFKPTTAATKHRSSPRSCLLLKTLLVILCIYIKRVTSQHQHQQQQVVDVWDTSLHKALGATEGLLPLETELHGVEGDLAYDITCPLDVAIVVKDYYTRSTTDSKLRERANKWLRKVREQVYVSWRKNDGPVSRPDGEPYEKDERGHITLMKLSQSDAGYWNCLLNYSHFDKEARTFLKLYPAVSIRLDVDEMRDVLLDVKPVIAFPPSDQFVKLNENATFTCKRAFETLTHQTTRWFVSICAKDDTECKEKFNEAYERAQEEGTPQYLQQYIIEGHYGDEFNIVNVSDSDVGYYGCLIVNQRGMDIRRGKLQLFLFYPESTTITSTISPTTTSAPANSNTTTNISTTTTPVSSNRSIINISTTAPTPPPPFPVLDVSASQQQPKIHTIYLTIGLTIIFVCLLTLSILTRLSRFIRKDKKNLGALLMPEPIVGVNCSANLRQHLPSGDCPDIYNIGKSADGFISGHLLQSNGHLMSQSICSRNLDKENNPSISSNNSNSDEASSWGKSVSQYQGDNSRTLYLHTSNTTTTTVPLYDHPPSTGTTRLISGTLLQDACVINPTYGLLRPESDATDWTFPRRNLERLNKIGEGQFGEVWRFKARQKDGNENYVAVKQLKERVGLGDRERLELIAEIEIMKLVNDHPNVIKILHYCADDYEPLLLIMEYAEHGKLQTYLRNCRSFRKSFSCLNDFNSIITSKELIKFSYHIAKGMEYVASKGIVHRDLASRNILVSKDKICKVADFGFARRVGDECAYERTTENPVPVKWMAPEALVENKFTTKSDVFSLGILMWEIVTLGATPYEYLTSTEVYKKVTNGGRLDKPLHCKNEFYQIMASCWLHNPAQRPSFKELAEKLEKLLLSENDYIELDQYPEHAYYNILNVAEKEIVHLEEP